MDDSHETYYVLDAVAALKPSSVLDVGCGEMTVRLATLCEQSRRAGPLRTRPTGLLQYLAQTKRLVDRLCAEWRVGEF